jgi:signal transduction histidine kinase
VTTFQLTVVGLTADGVGRPYAGGLGLINMRERVLQLDGFEFDSEPGRGTTVRVTVPFRADSKFLYKSSC